MDAARPLTHAVAGAPLRPSSLVRLLMTLGLSGFIACTPTQTRYPEQQLPDGLAPADTSGAEPADVTDVPDVAAGQDAGVSDVATPRDVSGDAATPGIVCSDGAPEDTDRWWQGAVVYEIFVRSFQDSDGDGIGDLQGVIDRLDYLNDGDATTHDDLGVDAIWLMPVNPSPSEHGYDVTDYRDINPEYGTLQTFDALVAAAKARGIRVVMDLVLNHTSDKHPWFVKGKRGGAAPTADWYVFRDEVPAGWGQPWAPATSVWHTLGDRYYYALFWEGMPDLNVANPAVQAELRDIGAFWAAHGVAGFRLDAARYLVETGGGAGQADQPATHAFWQSFRQQLGDDTLLLGEVWTALATGATYVGPGELQLVFDFDREAGLRDALRLGTAAPAGSALCNALALAPGGRLATFLGNHDLDRLGTDLRDAGAQRAAFALLATMPGVPVLYYGEELGLANGAGGGDRAKRLPMRWDDSPHHGFSTGSAVWADDTMDPAVAAVAAQSADPASLLSFVRRLLALRRDSPALRHGQTSRLDVAGAPGVLAFVRHVADESMLVVVNTDDAASPPLALTATGVFGGTPVAELGAGPASVGGDGVAFDSLDPWGVRIVRFRR